MGSLLIRDIHTLVTMDGTAANDAGRTVLHGAYIFANDGEIVRIGVDVPKGLRPDRMARAPYAIAVPGFVNTHHHLYQTLTRAVPAATNAGLFDWLTTLYPVWAHLDEEALYLAALVGMAELMLSGCTTTTDHHYVFPRGETGLIDAEIAAAKKIGIRFHPTRGSMSVGQSRGGLPPDSLVQDEDTILADCQRLIRKHHDPKPGAMVRIALAPCSPFSVSLELMRATAELAEREGVRLHTHLAETRNEDIYCQKRYHKRPLELLDACGWLGERTWLAHGVHFNHRKTLRLGRRGVGVAHCPTSNMRLGSGMAPVLDLRRAGCPVGLGVDGSASNDSSHMLAEVRQALLLNRLAHGAQAMNVWEALHMATVEGARCLGRNDVGVLAPGMRADVAMFDLRDLGYSGAGDPVSALLLCAPTRVQALVVEGRVVVEDGRLTRLAIEPVLRRHRQCAALLHRAASGDRKRTVVAA